MKKQTHILALMAAALLALASLASGGKLHAAQDSPAPYVDIAGLLPALFAPTADGVEEVDQSRVVESGMTTADAADEAASPETGKVVRFTATTGLDSFLSYRMDFDVSFDGTRQRLPASGNAEGILEATNNPDAQHLQATLAGEAFRQLGVLGTVEVYRVNDTVYFQDPQDGAWIGLSERLVNRFLPDGIPAPEDYVKLPVSAVLQPGWRVVNGVVTQRYTFGPEGLADGQTYDDVEGTIWVAVNGDFIVRYEATLTGQHDDLAAGGVELMDNGTITVKYELSDINDSLAIEAPDGAGGLSLQRILTLLGSLR